VHGVAHQPVASHEWREKGRAVDEVDESMTRRLKIRR
jgi:hypothetical protein